MIAADTNLLLRLVAVEDDAAQSAQAARWFKRHVPEGIYIDAIVLVEAVWVLRARYHRSRVEIAAFLRSLLETVGIGVSDVAAVRRALAAYRDGRGDFADYLIRERAREAGAIPTATFDRALKGEAGFTVVG
ncbi:MAG: PIN domain-containing protein [Gemmatimonadaceae bacterium]|nr:PIN domain-containing protein [Gemmatimonadaceae bacterium]